MTGSGSLAGRHILITGAGSGIGQAAAVEAVTEGARVTLVGRRPDALAETVELIDADRQVDALACPADIADPTAVDRIVTTSTENFGPVDGLVNNAGIARFEAIEQARPEDLDLMFRVHVYGPARLIQHCLPSLRERRGSIVNVTSVGGALATPRRSFYGATKAAINHLTRSLAVELAPEVRVNAILPGPVDTPIYDDLGISAVETAELRSRLSEATPLARFGRSEEVAHWVCLLLGDASAWMTGVLLPVDGGRCA
ncbi:SDR family NAD(P)-dependent oxidoreductase [Saccharopolyspora hattusasensis]|uniref:SDR family NAD(P)-dependent oxidoreductase n=1 Tax=Saccharopolyspora hattusasensis TaxID=1128679 RepID=UPI003D97C773